MPEFLHGLGEHGFATVDKKKVQEQQTSIKEVSYNISQQSFTKKRMFSSIGDICLNAISLGDAFHIFPAAVYTSGPSCPKAD